MKATCSNLMMSLAVASVVFLIAADFAEARRGGRGGGGHRMMRGGPAASGSFNRSRARPSMNRSRRPTNRGMDRDLGRSTSRTRPRDLDPGTSVTRPRDPGTSLTRPRDLDPGTGVTRPGDRDPGDNLTRPGDPDDGSRPVIDPDRADEIKDNRQDRYDNRQEYYGDRQEYYNDRNEWYEDRWRAGAYISVVSWNSMNCGYDTVILNATTYYICDGIRYERVYRGSEVIFIAVN